MKTHLITNQEDHSNDRLFYHCPGCKHLHSVEPFRWNWNGDADNPTLSPSVRHFIPKSEYGPEVTVCHYFVRNGNIEYCSDCEHELRGQTVPLPELTDDHLSSLK